MPVPLALTWDMARFTAWMNRLEQAVPDAAEGIVRDTTQSVRSDTVTGWPIDTGASMNAWSPPERLGEATYRLTNAIGYAVIIEYGGFKGGGPKTHRVPAEVLEGGFTVNPGIYAIQVPAAPLRRALAHHYGDMTTRLREELRRA